ncbi:MAG: DUF4388 domain-containing protein [Bradymonadaceae bacterium]
MDADGADGYVLKFISGKYEGEEYPLEEGSEVEIGRSSELDMVLVEDMVSRRHARISATDGELEIEDIGSTNGTFVNGDKVQQASLETGDRILIGTSIIKLVDAERPLEVSTGLESETAAGEEMEPSDLDGDDDAERPTTRPDPDADRRGKASKEEVESPSSSETGQQHHARTMKGSLSGLIEEVPLPDLLQLFSSSRKSGVLTVQRRSDLGRVYLRDGRVYYATINEDPDVSPHKAFYRMLRWEEGTFALEQPDEEPSFEDEIDESIENLLMEGMKQLDEIRNLGEDVPDYDDVLQVSQPLVPPLRNLSDELLDTLQLIFNYGRVSTVLNKSLASDLETLEDVVELRQGDYIEVDE